MVTLMKTFTSQGHACYAPDMPGFGSSFDPADNPPSISWYCDLYHDHLFPALGLSPGNFHLVGHHSGAVIGLEMSVLYPSLLKSLVSIGPAVMTAQQREDMKSRYLHTFNKPEPSGSYLQKTFDYLRDKPHNIPSATDLDLLHREVQDHIRAWKGRNQIYTCVWAQDSEMLLKKISTPMLALCARDDVLWAFIGGFRTLRPDIKVEEIKGGNFCPDRGAGSIAEKIGIWLEEIDN